MVLWSVPFVVGSSWEPPKRPDGYGGKSLHTGGRHVVVTIGIIGEVGKIGQV